MLTDVILSPHLVRSLAILHGTTQTLESKLAVARGSKSREVIQKAKEWDQHQISYMC